MATSLLERLIGKPNLSPVEKARNDRISQDKAVAKNNALSYGTLPVSANRTYGPTLNAPLPAKPPQNFNYSQVSAPTTPSTANTAAPVTPKAPVSGGGYTSSDPSIQARIKEMQGQASGASRPLNAPTSMPVPPSPQSMPVPPSPQSMPAGESVSPAGAGIKDAAFRAAQNNINTYREKVLSAMSPGEQERALADELAQFQGDAKRGIAGLEGQGRGIPLALVRGQQGKLQEQAALEEQTLLARLNAQQQARQAELAGAQAALGFEQFDFEKELKRQELEAQNIKPIEVGGNLVALNPQTGQYEVVYQGPNEATKPVTLGSGQMLIDPTTGEQIAFNPATLNQPASVQEYQYAQGQGYTGSFLDYQNAKRNAGAANTDLAQAVIQNPGLFNQLTPSDKAAIIPILNEAGFTQFGKPLSDAAIKEINQTNTAITQLQDLKETIQDNLQFIGPLSGLQALNPYSEARQLQAKVDLVKQNVGRALEGGVLRKEDEEKYKKILATLTDTPETALYKIENLVTQLQSDVDAYKELQMLSGRNVPQSSVGSSQKAKSAYEQLNPGQSYDDAVRNYGQDAVDQYLKEQGFTSALNTAVNGSIQLGSRLAQVNNNPGNLRFAGQQGASQGEGGFARFSSPQAGYQALLNQISLDASRGHTLATFINKYAPPSENATNQYVQQMVEWTGYPPNTPLASIDPNRLAPAMIRKESSSTIG